MTTAAHSASDATIAEALRASDERYRFLTENIPVQVWTSLPDGRLDYVSDQTARSFGMSAAQLLVDGWQNVVHADDLPLAIERWTHALATGEKYEVEFRLKLASGEYAWHLARAVPQRDDSGAIVRWFGTNTNIEEQRAHQRQMEGLARQLAERNGLLALEAAIGSILTDTVSTADALNACAEAVVQHMGAAFARIWTASEDGTMLELQASAGLYTHLDGAHGRVPVGQFKIGQIAAERKPHLTNRVVGDPRVGDQAWASREGMVAFAGYPIVFGDRLVGVIAAFAKHPLSEPSLAALGSVANALAQALERREAALRVDAERARFLAQEQRARREAEAAQSRAELASRAKDEFLATASHELRTPLNAILGWARLLRGGTLDASGFQRGLETIERNAKAQVQLIEDILDGSRIITGNLHLEIRASDLTAIVQSAIDAVRPAAAARNITLTTTLDPSASRILGDPDRLQQVVWNLVNNALKFTPKGGHVEVRVVRVGTSIELIVKDDGQGISADFLPHVFERFRQADATTTRRHGGLGLGLALVRHLVEAHGGSVRAESPGEGKGATFTVTLPVQAVFPAVLERARPTPPGEERLATLPPRSLEGVKVLVTDDEIDARDLVATLLIAHGADVQVAGSAQQAIEVLTGSSGSSIGMLISDIGMPGTDGYSLIGRVRQIGLGGPRVPAIALTAYAREEDKRRAIEAGFDSYLSKPVEPDALVKMVGQMARRGGSAAI